MSIEKGSHMTRKKTCVCQCGHQGLVKRLNVPKSEINSVKIKIYLFKCPRESRSLRPKPKNELISFKWNYFLDDILHILQNATGKCKLRCSFYSIFSISILQLKTRPFTTVYIFTVVHNMSCRLVGEDLG